METNKPKVFISSTIQDFYDLRSAIKYHLESLGFEVFLSEYNDFPKELDKNTYDECLKNIEYAQYFILLVGSRVGGFYDRNNGISITEKEYEKAYEQLKKGKLKLVIIIRENLWLARDEREKLEEILTNDYKLKNDLSKDDINNIKNFKSSIVNDAKFTFNFINKVARTEEMEIAQLSSTNFPIGNWIHTFKTFRDIVDILKTGFRISDNLEDIALKENLKYEIIKNLKNFFQKINGKIYPINVYANSVARHYKGETDGQSIFTKSEFGLFNLFLIFGIGKAGNLKTEFIDNALRLGKFLDYDYIRSRFNQSVLSKSLLKLKEYIESLKYIESMQNLNIENRLALFDNYKIKTESYEISNILLYTILSIHKLQNKIIDLSFAIWLEMEGVSGLLDSYNFDETGPSKKISEELKTEQVTETDLINYIERDIIKAKNNES